MKTLKQTVENGKKPTGLRFPEVHERWAGTCQYINILYTYSGVNQSIEQANVMPSFLMQTVSCDFGLKGTNHATFSLWFYQNQIHIEMLCNDVVE